MWALSALTVAAGSLFVGSASAQTWAGGRTTPSLGEIVAIDATGETGWLYGSEDLFGDGAMFGQQERSVDLRTAYASTDPTQFWARVHVSDANAAGGNVTVYVFIDNDRSPITGGGADATEIEPRFVDDPTPGGFDYVLEVGGNGSIRELWEHSAMMGSFRAVGVPMMGAEAEAGQDRDPIEVNGSDHGYLQGTIDLDLVGLTSACDANLFFRSVIASGPNGDGDLEVGLFAPCDPVDGNGDGVPDLAVPSDGCTSDAECPGFGLCIDGRCVVPQPCAADDDCDADETCDPNGVCVPSGGGMCTTRAECGALVCRDAVCAPCLSDAECGGTERCLADGRCIPSGLTPGVGGGSAVGGGAPFPILPGENVQGGALSCAMSTSPAGRTLAIAWGLLCGALLARRRRRAP